ncbi:MAG: serine/threonine dehydratase [Actinobacteria bacterium]|nr:serine/threonine dehydratase [Actinomycetota bacterium]
MVGFRRSRGRPLDVIDRAAVEDAAERIAPYVRPTPTVELDGVVFKLEQLQVAGSFKARGAFTLLTDPALGDRDVVAASGGNFALALATAARALDRKAIVFVPGSSPASKIDALRQVGADVRVVEGYYPQALSAAEAYHESHDAVWAHAYDHEAMIIGAATLGREMEGQAALDTVLVAVGGGGLIGGVAAWYRDRARVVGVEPEGCPTLHAALGAGRPVEAPVGGIAASSMGARQLGSHTWEVREWIAGSVLVSDDEIVAGQRWLWDTVRLLVEPGGAVACAALRSGRYAPVDGERVGVIVCGANVDPASLA